MKSGCGRSSRRCRGATLIEVLAGLALLGSLAVAMVLAKADLTAQDALARHKLAAAAAADRLMTGWWADPAAMPRDDRGDVPGQPGLRWRTRPIDPPETPDAASHPTLRCELVRLEMWFGELPEPVLTLDVVCPVEEDTGHETRRRPRG